MRVRWQRIRVRSVHGTTLKDVDESEGQARGIDGKESHVVGPAKDFFALGQGKVENEDGGFNSHQRRIVEDGKGIIGTVETGPIVEWNIMVVKAQTLAGRVEEREREAKVDQPSQ